MEQKPRRQGVQLADLLRRAKQMEPKPAPPAEQEAEQPAPPQKPEAQAPPEAPPATAPAHVARITHPAPEEPGEEARTVTIEVVLSTKQLAQILAQREPEVMTLDQAANYLQIGPDYLARLARTGHVPGTKIGRSWRFKKTLLDEWLDKRSRSAQHSAQEDSDDRP